MQANPPAPDCREDDLEQACAVQISFDGTTDADTLLHRYEWREGAQLHGLVDYYVFGHIAMITHTEINPALAGRGYGAELARRMLDHIRTEGHQVVPVCGFMAHFMRKNREYVDLATPGARPVFDI